MESLSPEVAYATKPNLKFPGTQAQATAAESLAQSRLNDSFAATGETVTVPAGTIKVAT
jgi:hypothetical protein